MAEIERKRKEVTVCCIVPEEKIIKARADLEEEKLNRSASQSGPGRRPL